MKNFEEINKLLKTWAEERNLLGENANPDAQGNRITGELGEMLQAYEKHQEAELQDSIGDLLVTICVFCHQIGENPIKCFNEAYDTIAHRKGKTVNGTFIKESDLKGEA